MHRLLQINVTANWGSTGKIAESIGVEAIKHGWESFMAYGRWSNPSHSQLIRVGGSLNKYFHYAEQRIRDNEGLCSRIATKKLIRQIDKIEPDVVQLHNIHDHYLNYRLLFEYLNQTGIPVVWTFHDCWAFTGHCFHFVSKNCVKWRKGCCDCPMRSVYPKTLFDRSKENYELKRELFGGCKNLTIVPVSEWIADYVKQSFLKDKRMEIIKNGVDLSVFQPSEKKDIDDNSFVILAVSSVWNQDKGLNDIVKLKSILPPDFRIVIVGLTENQIKELPLGIKGIRRTQNVQELVQLYSNADVLINPTYADTFPTVNLEALACGIPVITYKTGGSPEAIDKNGKTGYVVEQGDVYSMAKAIKVVAENGRGFYSSFCRERAETHFDKNKAFENYINLYNNLLGIK